MINQSKSLHIINRRVLIFTVVEMPPWAVVIWDQCDHHVIQLMDERKKTEECADGSEVKRFLSCSLHCHDMIKLITAC